MMAMSTGWVRSLPLVFVFCGCGAQGGGEVGSGSFGQPLTYVTCDGPEDLGQSCGAYGRVCSATAQCVYPAACNSSATGTGVFRGDATVDATDTSGDLLLLSGIWCVTGNLTVTGTQLTSLGALSGLVAVGNSLTVQQNANLLGLSGLDALQSAGSVRVVANAKLPNLAGLGGLNRLSSLEVVGNNQLTTLNGLAPVDITSSVSLTGNGKLAEVNALSGVVGSLYGYLHIQNEASLADLSGLSGVTSVGSSLRIFNSDALTNLHGLDAITRVGGELLISLNDRLATLDGLIAVTQVGSAKIQSNPLLDECAVQTLVSRTATTCTACTGQLACTSSGVECGVPACIGSVCGGVPAPAGTACSQGFCDASGACASPAMLAVFSVSDGSVSNPPATRDGVFNPGDVVSVATRVENHGPVTFTTSSMRIVSADPYVSSVWPYPIYTNQVLSGTSGFAYPWLRISNNAPEGHVIPYAVEVDYTISGVTRTASLPMSLIVGPGDVVPGSPLSLDLIRYDDGHYANANGRDGHFAPGEYISVEYRIRNWSGAALTIGNRVLATTYVGATWQTIGAAPVVAAWDGVSGQFEVLLAADAPIGQFEGSLEVTGTVGGEPFVATMPVSFPVTVP